MPINWIKIFRYEIIRPFTKPTALLIDKPIDGFAIAIYCFDMMARNVKQRPLVG